MTSTSLSIRPRPNYQQDSRNFSYVNPTNNYPLTGVNRIEEELLKVTQPEPTQLSLRQNAALNRPPQSLVLTGDLGPDVGYEEMLAARGPLRQALMH